LLLAAASAIDEPPRELEHELLRQLERSQSRLDALDALDEETKLYDSLPALDSTRRYTSSPPANDRSIAQAASPSQPVKLFSGSPVPQPQAHRVIVLTAHEGGASRIIGGAILTLDPGTSVELDPRIVEAVAGALAPA
jgi:hypothetical protein